MLITDIVQEVFYEVPHAPEPLIETSILRASQDFCQRTRRWVVAGTDLDTVVDQVDYTLTAPAQTDVDGNSLLFRIVGIDKILDENKRPFTMFTYNDEVLTFTEIPKSIITFTIELQLKPLESATAIYDPLFEDYSEGILSGAKYRMLRMRGVAWENQVGAKDNLTIYNQQIHKCRTNKWNEDGTKELTRHMTGW